MKWLSRVVAVCLLVLWAPVTVHCTLEAMPQLSFLSSCCGDNAGGDCDHCAGDACQAVESGHYRLEDNPDIAPQWNPQPGLLACLLLPACWDTDACVVLVPCATAPPELAATWQFVQRAAPRARAPSLTA
ncbi:MAG: hypothetical protein H7A46_16285 [Verrucomicrobiales bacterium]|nr:hypothetical protein [Verrucomicrobiales bacterium]